MCKKIFIFSIIFILFLLTSVCFATDTINMDLTNSSTTSNTISNDISNNLDSIVDNTTIDSTTIDNANSDLSEDLYTEDTYTDTFEDESAPVISTTTTYDDSGELSITNIINIILIVVGIVIILLGIAIIIKIK